MSKVLYIAGPMSNIAQYNFPLFEAVAVALRDDGYAIVSPHECDSEETRKAAWASPDGKHNPDVASESWGTCLARDVMMLADGFIVDVEAFAKRENFPAGADGDVVKIDGIAFLPNWDKSRGARLEAFVGLLTGKSFYVVTDILREGGDVEYRLDEVTAEWVQAKLAAPWAEGIRMHTPL
jgi:hypothetical protein